MGAGALYAALPASLLVAGPRWLLAALVLLLVIPAEVSHRRGNQSLNQALGYILNGLITLAMIVSLTLLIEALADHKVTPQELLRSAAISPTDVPVLSRWAKVLMMIQALISLLVIVLLAARAVNIL